MDSKNILRVALRIGAVVIAIKIIELYPPHYASYTIRDDFNWYLFIGIILLPTLIALFISVTMWFYPDYYLKYLPIEESSEKVSTLDMHEVGSVLIAIIGVYIICFSFADLIYHITFVKIMNERLMSYASIEPERMALIVATIVEIIFGIFLIFGCSLITRSFLRFKKELKGNL